MKSVVLIAAMIAAGLLAGLFYAYAVSVLPGLSRSDDRTFVEGVRGINVAILNGWFLLTFLGAPVLALAALLLDPRSGPTLWWLVTGFACLLAVLVVTGVVHVPLNNALAAGGTDYAQLRARFEAPWVRWNVLRTLFSLAGFASLVGALLTRRPA
jgi:uncharacterized membrane protein